VTGTHITRELYNISNNDIGDTRILKLGDTDDNI